ncbi:MAG: SAM-dependent chlorinase/fluorinase [Planctomycetaceae bacterium]|nr:SAM-dependent chlorinase/fluorinase [Planctomycetales bacterium]MCB9927201.1 SAM-dependent chlorinase/fluorinase [Planctomycetaceae bacterium]
MPPAIITLTTDFGLADTYVAQMKGAILSINPAAKIIDVTHEIPPQHILCGSMAIGEMWNIFPAGTIHVAVIDPGVGTTREIVAAECDGHFFVTPNNGLLSHVHKASAKCEFVVAQNRSFWRVKVSNTFHGRDIMAPIAAHLSLGVSLTQIGPSATDVKLLDIVGPRFTERQLIGRIISIDRFGNLITDIGLAHLRQIPMRDVVVRCKQREIAGISQTYGQHSRGALIAIISSQGRLELATVNGNAAVEVGASIEDSVVIDW